MTAARRTLTALAAAAALALTGACSAEPEPTPEPTTPEPVEEVEPEPEPVVTGDLKMVWRVEYENEVGSVAVSPDGDHVAVGERASYVHRLADGTLVEAAVHYTSPRSVAYDHDGSLLATGLSLHGVAVTTGRGEPVEALATLQSFDGHPGAHLGDGYDSVASFSPDGEHLATGNRDGLVWLWQVADGSQVAELTDPDPAPGPPATRSVVHIDHHPGGELLAAVHTNCTVNVWDVAAATITHEFELETGDGSCGQAGRTFRFSPDGETMAGMVRDGNDQVIRFWQVSDGEPVLDLPVLERVRAIDFSPDGSLLVVASRLGTTIWDVGAGVQLHELDEEFDATATQQPLDAAFTPDGGHVVVARQDGAVELWRLPGATELVPPPMDPVEPPPLPGDVLFDTGSSELKPAADDVLSALAADLLAALPEASLTFVGHTDSRGDAADNMQLSLDRATSVRDWFADWAAANGADGWTFDVDGRGQTELKAPDTDADGEFLPEAGQLNRRVEIEIDAG